MSSFSASTKPNFHLVPYRFDSSFCHVRALSKRAGSAIGGGRTDDATVQVAQFRRCSAYYCETEEETKSNCEPNITVWENLHEHCVSA
ncbi:Hypothetical predicted protein [Prunus dulcis]|uniref:Uncharacterized protein n=1 Tax=Prunus dulcis TaxID=3755 RepID=A0A5E4G277_PRUDU|nr:Hypothetical predicted protein [Prunus dulcis]